MKCAACSRTNLPGGLRCVYCGVHFPALLDFVFDAPGLATSSARSEPTATTAAVAQSNNRNRGIIGTLAFLALKAKSLLVLFKFGKIALTLGSMFVYIAVYSRVFGWKFATGFAVCIFIHEMGHVTVNWMKGLKATAPMFIPFVGALIFIKQFPNDPKIQSESGAGGPAAGLLAALGCYLIGLATGSPFWFALAGLGAFINLFNMVPFPPLDGSHIVTVFSPRIYTAVLLTLLVTTIKLGFGSAMGHYSVILVFIIIVGFVFRLGKAADTRHMLAAPAVRVRMAFIFVGLCLGLTLLGAASSSSLARVQSRIHATASDADTLNRYAFQPDDQPTQASEPPSRISTGAVIVCSTLTLAITTALWCLSSFLIYRCGGRSPHIIWVAAVVSLYCFCLNALLVAAHPYYFQYFAVVGAIIAAACAAAVFSIYTSVHKVTFAGAGATLLMSHALAWAGAAALIFAYAFDSMPVAAAVLAGAALYATMSWWVVSLLVAQAYSQLGKTAKAIGWFNKTLAGNPPPDARIGISFQLLDLELRLSHGTEALSTVEALAQLSTDGGQSIRLLWLRSAALMLLDRYDACLECIEQLLQITENDPDVYNRLLFAHVRLAGLTRQRGWYDESISQIERVQARLTSANRSLQARMYITRAQVLCSIGDIDGAVRDCKLGLDLSKETAVRERAALVQSAIMMAGGHIQDGVRTLEVALREAEGDLEIQYAYAMALRASGDSAGAVQRLKGLAAGFPQEHWGRLAADAIGVGDIGSA